MEKKSTKEESEIPIQRRIRSYVVQDEIGRGAFSVVYRVFCEKYSQTFVAKVITISPTTDKAQQFIISFESEIKSLLSLSHPNVIRIYDFFREENQLFLIFQDCPFGSLQTEIDNNNLKKKVMKGGRLVSIAKVLLEAIKACHDANVAHRDIKPANILFDKYKRPILADFGLSERLSRDGEKLSEKHSGSLAYKAPEIFSNVPYSAFKPDIWSLGVVFYEMSTGHLPWITCSTSLALKKAIVTADFNIPKEVDSEFAEVIGAMMTLDPRRRPTAEKILKMPIFEHQSELSSSYSITSAPTSNLSPSSILNPNLDSIPNLNSSSINTNLNSSCGITAMPSKIYSGGSKMSKIKTSKSAAVGGSKMRSHSLLLSPMRPTERSAKTSRSFRVASSISGTRANCTNE